METISKIIFWTARSKKDLAKIMLFNTTLFSLEKAKRIAFKIENRTVILSDFHEIGAVDEEFSHLKKTYRKIFEHHCKITYRIGNNKIFIVRVFDMRQNPNKNK